MIVGATKRLAAAWVAEHALETPGFEGAYLAGSAAWMEDENTLPDASDVDVSVVVSPVDGGAERRKLGKVLYREMVIDASYVTSSLLRDADAVLGDYQIASALHANNILVDTTGRLGALQADVEREFAKVAQVRRRRDAALDKVLAGQRPVNRSVPLHTHVLGWSFPASVATHLLLVAALENPTVRKRYVAARAVLARFDRLEVHDTLLRMLGCADMSEQAVTQHLDRLVDVFDAAVDLPADPFFFAGDISTHGRRISIDGSRELIEQGLHREAVYWLVATYSRALQILDHNDRLEAWHEASFMRLLTDVGVTSHEDIARRNQEVASMLPCVAAVADEIIAVNPAIVAD